MEVNNFPDAIAWLQKNNLTWIHSETTKIKNAIEKTLTAKGFVAPFTPIYRWKKEESKTRCFAKDKELSFVYIVRCGSGIYHLLARDCDKNEHYEIKPTLDEFYLKICINQ